MPRTEAAQFLFAPQLNNYAHFIEALVQINVFQYEGRTLPCGAYIIQTYIQIDACRILSQKKDRILDLTLCGALFNLLSPRLMDANNAMSTLYQYILLIAGTGISKKTPVDPVANKQ